jgi:hypothetical protein
MMPYKKLQKRSTIEMVNRITVLINSLPKQNGIHSVLSPREIVTGKKFRCPSIRIGQYVQGHTGGTNSTDEERSIDGLYIGRADNGSGHVVFKLNTKQPMSVNRVTTIPTTEAIITTVNDIGEGENQPEGIEFSDMHGRITLADFAANDNDNDSNASDDGFKIDEEYQDELKNDIVLEQREGIIGNDDPDSQEDYFQNPIQQHNNDDELAPEILNNRTRSGNNPIVALANTTQSKQECERDKKKKRSVLEEQTALAEEDLEEDTVAINSTKLGVDDVSQNDVDPGIPSELESDLGPYWALAHTCQAYVPNTITSYRLVPARTCFF